MLYVEDPRTAQFMVSEEENYYSRDAVVIALGQLLKAGHVLGKITLGAAVAQATVGNVGTGAIGAVTVNGAAHVGAYALKCIEFGGDLSAVFEMMAPDGRRLADVKTGVPAAGDLTFTIAEGGALNPVGAGGAMGTNTGNPTFGAIAVAAPAQIGVYKLVMADPTHFVVEDPNGVEVGHGDLGVAFAAGGLGFTLTAGATACIAGDTFTVTVSDAGGTPFAIGDGFTITVAAGAGTYKEWNPANTDGSQIAVAVSYAAVDATLAAANATIISRQAQVRGSDLVYFAGALAADQANAALQLAAAGIIVR